ncbi:hypothetical protein PTSG_13095 [Salpingoeca rosetta]|uniref:Small-subunit processome Utp12 domain-containing protein n=1 Tax=Salpingoeca rosetta (strain ATCC 50818 / BSB-021) TaxID=946362 RepID=F2UPW9_SALR5|nr:uncharacterized protein PTSG_13095 [Salpingoeca rosetta]EGD79799.1 hypothetical protein PTSG_13095 [Salpingoeca rosetta]|eukprot:XP_004988748.1 hypothetical protein PTSG_13095 [Salpingoeca rosetta]
MFGDIKACDFSPDGFFFAVLGVNGQLRVFETATNTQRLITSITTDKDDQHSEHTTLDRRQRSRHINCFTWKPPTQEKKRRRAKKQADPTILAGYSTGEIGLISVNSGATQFWTPDDDDSETHKHNVTALAWHAEASAVFSLDQRGTVLKWSQDGKHSEQFLKRAVKSARSLSAGLPTADNQHTILVAGRDIYVYAVDGATELKRISAHVNPVSRLLLCTRSDVQGVFSFVSSDDNDRQINLWSLDVTEKKQQLLMAIESPAQPAAVTYSAGAKKNSALRVAVLGLNGCLYVYDGLSKVHKTPVATIRMETGDVPSKKVSIISAQFPAERNEQTIHIARGNAIDPTFEDLTLGSTAQDQLLTRDAPLELFQSVSKQQQKLFKDRAPTAKPTILGAAQVGSVQSKPSEEAIKPLSKQFANLLKETGADQLPQGYTRDGQPRSGTLIGMLMQALHSSDNALLDECLSSATERIVKATTARLPPKFVPVFFKKIVHKLEARPARGSSLLVWIRCLLMAHTSYLLTLPNLADMLKDLYGMAEARLAAFPAIARLSGRLDLLLAHADRTDQGLEDDLADVDEDIVPRAVYIEPEEDDEEEEEAGADGEDEEEDDEDEDEWEPVEVPGEDDALFDDVLGMSEMEDSDEDEDDAASGKLLGDDDEDEEDDEAEEESDDDDEEEEDDDDDEEEEEGDNAMDEDDDDDDEANDSD